MRQLFCALSITLTFSLSSTLRDGDENALVPMIASSPAPARLVLLSSGYLLLILPPLLRKAANVVLQRNKYVSALIL